MGDTLTGVRTPSTSWFQRLLNRLRTAPSRPPSWHATRQINVRPGSGRHRANAGGIPISYQLPNGDIVTYRRRP